MDPLVISLIVLVVLLVTALTVLYFYPQSCPECTECESTTCPVSNTEILCTTEGYTKSSGSDITISKSKYCESKLNEINLTKDQFKNALMTNFFIKRVSDGTVYVGSLLTQLNKTNVDEWFKTAKNPINGPPMTDRERKFFGKIGAIPGDSTADSSLWSTVDDTTGGVINGTGSYQILDTVKTLEAVEKYLKEDPNSDYKKYCN